VESDTSGTFVLMEAQLQYKTHTNRKKGKYLQTTMRLEWQKPSADEVGSLMLTTSGDSSPVGRRGRRGLSGEPMSFCMDASTSLQLQSGRSGKYPIILIKARSDSPGYMKIRIPRSSWGRPCTGSEDCTIVLQGIAFV